MEGGDYFKFFRHKGEIIRGRRLVEGRLLFDDKERKQKQNGEL